MRWIERGELGGLLDLIRDDGYRMVGPTLGEGALVFDDIDGVDDLPAGWTDRQAPGRYRLEQRGDDRLFGHRNGPDSAKRFLFPPREPLVQIRRTGGGAERASVEVTGPPLALIGLRSCDVAAVAIQDRIFVGGPHRDERYAARREACLIVAVNCLEAGELCFCASMDTGPRATSGFDLSLTELDDGFVAEAGSDTGAALLDRLDAPAAGDDSITAVDRGLEACRKQMGRELDRDGLPGLLFANLDHHRWDQVAGRCLACGNCTQVCPTCFCFTVDDVSLLDGADSTRERSWDSCFSQDHSTIHGAEFRPLIKDRYRQWLTHKLGSWVSQFGVSGCVGCGRCIAWCPVGIDITEEVAAIRGKLAQPAIDMPAPRSWPEPEPGAADPLVAIGVDVVEVIRETADTATLMVARPPGYELRPGQFNMLSVPAIGDVPISVSGADEAILEHTIRAVGAATEALCALEPGAQVGLRGPFGSSWPLDDVAGRPVTLIAGGIGLAPLRGAMRALIADPDGRGPVQLLYGAREPADILYDTELLGWDSLDHADVSVTVDRAARGWLGNVGFVTQLVRRKDTPPDGAYFICGPEVMMTHVIHLLEGAGVPPEHIYVTMERNMKCAAGFCGRCQYGPYFVCKDGPVFRYDQISFLFGHPGF